MSVYESAVKRPIMTALCFIAVVIFGIFSFMKLPIDLLPDIETNTLMIITSYPGASAEDIENNISKPLENTLNSVEHLKHMTSNSRENISLISLEFEYGYDIDDLTNDVRDKLDMVTSALPDEANSPIIFKFSADMIPIMMLSVKAGEEHMLDLYNILDDNVANPLARIDGVGTVSIAGAAKREINVYMDPAKMREYNISIETVSAKIAAENMNVPSGSFDVGSNTYPLRIKGEFKSPQELDSLVIASYNGANVYLVDIAERIVNGTQERAQKAFTDGTRGAMIVIQKQSGGNSVNIANAVREKLPEIQKRLPDGIEIGIINDTSDNIKKTVSTLGETIAYALLFVMLVVFIFLGRWRATVIIGITIPFSLIASFIYLLITDGSLNIISLSCLSIAIGNVVDDAIVVLENITTHIERGSSPKSAAVHGTNEVAVSVVASTLTMLAVFFPLTMITGMAGVLFKQLGWMMCVIMVVSTIAALTLIPMMCSRMLKLQKKQSKFFKIFYTPIGKGLDKLDNWYAKRINWAVRHRWTVLIVCFAVFFGSLATFPSIKSEFFPSQDSGTASAKLQLPIGTRVEMAEKIAMELTRKWQERYGKDLEVCNFSVGQADEDNTFASMNENGSHIISFNMTFVPLTERSKGMDVIGDEMRADIREYPEIARSNVSTGGGGMGGESKISFEIYGEDFGITDRLAQELKERLSKSDLISQINISRSDYQPEYHVDFDREKLARHGLSLGEAASQVRNCFNGALSTKYRENGEEYDVKVRYAPEFREDVATIEEIVLTTRTGAKIQVKDVANVIMRESPPSIERKDRERIVTVDAVTAAGVAMSEGVNLAMKEIDQMTIESGYSIQVAGSYEDQQESNAEMGLLAVLIIILVFIVMAAQFESLTYPFIIMFSVPFALSGVLIALYITGTTMNIMSIMGAIMLIGIVVKNGIVLIDYTMLLRGRGLGIIPATVRAARSRLRPILMTTLTTILGMVPLAVSQGVGAEMWRPLGIAVIGGLTISTIMTLTYTPVMYCIFGGNGIKRRRKKMKKQRELDEYWTEHKSEEMLINAKK